MQEMQVKQFRRVDREFMVGTKRLQWRILRCSAQGWENNSNLVDCKCAAAATIGENWFWVTVQYSRCTIIYAFLLFDGTRQCNIVCHSIHYKFMNRRNKFSNDQR